MFGPFLPITTIAIDRIRATRFRNGTFGGRLDRRLFFFTMINGISLHKLQNIYADRVARSGKGSGSYAFSMGAGGCRPGTKLTKGPQVTFQSPVM